MKSMSTTEPRRSPAPTLQGRYRLIRTLEAGERGANFLGYDLRLQRWRMIEVPSEGEAARLLVQEAELLARLEHPAVERVIDVGDDGPISFVVRDRLYGSVAEHLPLLPALAVSVILRIADGLAHAHARGIFHGHVRPSTIRFSDEGGPVLVGFAHPPEIDSSTTGRSGESWAHLSPEMRQRWEPDPRSEVYALAALLYTLVAGRHQTDLFYAEAYDGLLAPIPGALRPIVLGGCAYAPADRPKDMEAFRAALSSRVESLGAPGEPPWRSEPLPDRPPEQIVPDGPLRALISLLGPRPPSAKARPVSNAESTSTLNSNSRAKIPYEMPQVIRKDPGFRDPFEAVAPDDLPEYVDRSTPAGATPRPIHSHVDRMSSTRPPERRSAPRRRVTLLPILSVIGAMVATTLIGLAGVAWVATSAVRADQGLVDAVLAERAAAEMLASTSGDREALESAWFAFADAPTAENAAAYVRLAVAVGDVHTVSVEAQGAIERMEEALAYWEGR